MGSGAKRLSHHLMMKIHSEDCVLGCFYDVLMKHLYPNPGSATGAALRLHHAASCSPLATWSSLLALLVPCCSCQSLRPTMQPVVCWVQSQTACCCIEFCTNFTTVAFADKMQITGAFQLHHPSQKCHREACRAVHTAILSNAVSLSVVHK